MKKKVYHFVARARPGLSPLAQRDTALELWRLLRAEFQSNALACVLMPNHLHLAVLTANPKLSRRRIGFSLRSFTRKVAPGRRIWARQPALPLPTAQDKLGRLVRYIHLNPCRAGLTRDPWTWEFSTVREHSRSAMIPWVSDSLIEESTGRDARVWAEQHDRFLRVDSTVDAASVENNQSGASFHELKRGQLEDSIAALMNCRLTDLRLRGTSRDLLAHALVTQVAKRDTQCRTTLLQLSGDLGVCRKRLGLMKRNPLSERQMGAIGRHSGLIHNTQRPRNAQTRP